MDVLTTRAEARGSIKYRRRKIDIKLSDISPSMASQIVRNLLENWHISLEDIHP